MAIISTAITAIAMIRARDRLLRYMDRLPTSFTQRISPEEMEGT
jgi:hypothetical protein